MSHADASAATLTAEATSSTTDNTVAATHRSVSGMFAGGLTGGAAAWGALQIGATGSNTENAAAATGTNGSPSVAPIAVTMAPPPLVVDSTPTPSPQVSTTNANSSAQQFPTSSSFGGLQLAGLAAAATAAGAAFLPSASSAAASAALVRRPSGLASSMLLGLAPAVPPPASSSTAIPTSGVAASAGETVTAGTATAGPSSSAAASSVIFTPSSMAQETAGQRATRSLSYSITSVSSVNASAVAVSSASASTASILMLFDPSAVSPDLSSASNTHASSATFRFSSSASPAHAHSHPARPFSPLTSNPAATQAAAAAAVAAGPLTLAPAPVPAASPALRKSFTTGATATMSSIRQKIREQISGMRKEKGRRDQEEIVREWSTCLAKWNQYQPAVSGAAASFNGGSGLTPKELAANQKKLSGMLLSSGIPSHMRASVWLLMIGNGLGLTPQLFEDLRTSCAEKRKEYEAWRRQTNSNHLNAKHRHLAEAEAAAAAAAAAAASAGATAASSSAADAVPSAPSTDPSASPVSSSSASMPTFHPSPSPSPSASSAAGGGGGLGGGGGSATPQSTSTIHSFDSVDASLDPSCAMFSLIDQDLPRTFPELQFFHHDGPYEVPLRVVLEATAAYRAQKERERIQALAMQEMGDPAVAAAQFPSGSAPAPVFESSSASTSGYVQGMSFLASILFLALGDDDPFLAFVALTNLLENPAEPLSQLFSMRMEIMEDWLLRFDAQFLTSLPKLHAHFSAGIGLTPDMYLYKCQYGQRRMQLFPARSHLWFLRLLTC